MPLSDDELNDKFLELGVPVIGERSARSLLEQLWRTEKLTNVIYDVVEAKVPGELVAAGD